MQYLISYLPRSPYTCEVWYCGMYCVAISPAPVTGEYIWRGGGGIMAGSGRKPGSGGCGGLCITVWPPGWNSGAWGTTTTLRTPLSSITCAHWKRNDSLKSVFLQILNQNPARNPCTQGKQQGKTRPKANTLCICAPVAVWYPKGRIY